MKKYHRSRRSAAVFLAVLLVLAVFPAQALSKGAPPESEVYVSDKVGTGIQPEADDGGRIVIQGKLPKDGGEERLLSEHRNQVMLYPNSDGSYTGDYIIIYNPDYTDTTGKSTGNLTGLIETSVLEHLDGTKSSDEHHELHEDDCMLCGTPALMERTAEQAPPAFDEEGERISYSVGSTRNFTLSESPVSNNTLNFTCLAVGTHCYVWTPTDKTTPELHPLDNIDSTYAGTYASEFDSKFDLMRSSFGDHWNGSQGDGKVHLVFYNIATESWNGFFTSADFTNNGVPMVNIDTYPAIQNANGTVNPASKMFNVIVHEYQHLIHYSVCHANNKDDESMLTEMMSAASEEICYPGSSISGRIPNWLGVWANYYPYSDPYYELRNGMYYGSSGALSLYGWSQTSGLDSVSQYGKVSLYAQFLYTHLGGNTAFKTILNQFATHSSYTGGDAVDAVIRTQGANFTNDTATFNRAFWIGMVMNPENTGSLDSGWNSYGFQLQEGYDPSTCHGLTNPYDLLCPLVCTSTSSRTIKGGTALVVKPVGGRFIPPSGASSGLQYIGVFTHQRLHYNTVQGELDPDIYVSTTYPFIPSEGAAKSTNAGVASSASTIAYESFGFPASIRFRAKVAGEGNSSNVYDGLKVYLYNLNDENLQLQVYTTNNQWQEYEVIIPDPGPHASIWFRYEKDGSVNPTGDYAMIDNVEFIPRTDPTLSDALNYPGGDLTFTTGGDYPFHVEYIGGDDVGVSSNSGVNDSESYVTCRVPMYTGDQLEFEYTYDTEANYDFFQFLVNGAVTLQRSGHTEGDAWYSYTFTAYTSGIFTFTWRYVKDVSSHYGGDCVMVDNVRYISSMEQVYTLDYSLNVAGGDLHFTTSASPSFSGDYWYDDTIATAYNFRSPNTTATIQTTVTMFEGDELRFEYYVNSEENYDMFYFSVNGETEIAASGNRGWSYYSYTAEHTGSYTFVWEYSKDGTVDKYMDTVKLDNVEHYKLTPSLDTALNSENTDVLLHFVSSGTYPFIVNRDNPYGLYAHSSNDGVDSSYSSMTSSVSLNAGDVISFYYNVSSEENYDWFDFKVDGNTVIHQSGEPGILFYSYTVTSSGVHNLEWRYTKDSSRSVGNDMVTVHEVTVHSSGSSVLLGDVDGNGTVNAQDALLLMRYSLSLISTVPVMAAADVDGNGAVNAQDALLIMRYSIGLIPSL